MSSGPTVHELLIYYIGDTILMDVTCKDADGAVLDLTNVTTIEWFLDDANGAAAAFCTLSNGIEIGSGGPTSGKIEITVANTITKNYTAGYYRDQLRLTTNTGIVATQMVGLIQFKQALDAPVIWQASAAMHGGSGVATDLTL